MRDAEAVVPVDPFIALRKPLLPCATNGPGTPTGLPYWSVPPKIVEMTERRFVLAAFYLWWRRLRAGRA